MTAYQIVERARMHLSRVEPASEAESSIKRYLESYEPQPALPDDPYGLLVCSLALRGACVGNFGVGSVVVDAEGGVVAEGHNGVFYPYFRSDLHAEMVAMNDFEDRFRNSHGVGGYTLYTSLEPCPMCLVRLITSGIGRVLYVAVDEEGGMARNIDLLPPMWRMLAEGQVFERAKCSSPLAGTSLQIFLLNARRLNDAIMKR
jgi:cytosine deaminase